jgi:hypothetical protein
MKQGVWKSDWLAGFLNIPVLLIAAGRKGPG